MITIKTGRFVKIKVLGIDKNFDDELPLNEMLP
jgi:hypothetical protein